MLLFLKTKINRLAKFKETMLVQDPNQAQKVLLSSLKNIYQYMRLMHDQGKANNISVINIVPELI